MQVNDTLKTIFKMSIVAVAYGLVVYNEGALATICFSTIAVIFLFQGYSNGLAMLLGGISGLIGQLIRMDSTLLFESFALMAAICFINNLLHSSKINKYFIICIISLAYLLLSLAFAGVSFGYTVAIAIIKVKTIEFVFTVIIGLFIQYLLTRLENR